MMALSTSDFCSGFFSITLSSSPVNLFPERVAFVDVQLILFLFFVFFSSSGKNILGLWQNKINHQLLVVVLMVRAVLFVEKNHFV